MASDDKDDNGLELEDGNNTPEISDVQDVSGDAAPDKKDVIDVEIEAAGDDLDGDMDDDISPVESLAATAPGDVEDDFGHDLDVDITGDPDIDFAGEDDYAEPMKASGGGGIKKIVAPALVLVIAAGIGGYIVMNPQILGQGSGALPENTYVAQSPEASPFSSAPPQDITETASLTPVPSAPPEADMDDAFAESLPQPTVNQNETPSAPDMDGEEFAMAEPEMPEAPEMPEMPAFPDTSDAIDVAEVVDAPAAEEIVAEEPQADMADDLAALNLPVEEDEPEVAALIPMQDEPVLFDAPAEQGSAEEFEIAQAEVSEAPEATPPVMPEPEIEPAASDEMSTPSPMQEEVSQQASEPAMATHAGVSDEIAPASDFYFEGRVPTGTMATDIGPRKVDPQLEPATQFVVVKKTHEGMDSEALLVSANRALKLNRYESARDMFDQLYAKNPRDPRILMGRAVAQQHSGLPESAIKTYEELLDIRPNDADAMLNMLGLLRQQYPSVALRRLIDLHDKHPNNAGIAAQIGVTQADLGHYDDAMRYLGIASSLEPQNAQHTYNMAIIADRNGDTATAVSHYEKALEMDAVYSSGRSIPRETVYDRLAVLRRR